MYYARKKLTPIEVRDSIIKRDPAFNDTAALLAGVHNTLKRLVRQGELDSETDRGRTVYSWVGPKYGARNSLANMLERSRDRSPNRK